MFLYVCASNPYNENKVYLDLYYVIPATVSLEVEFLDTFDFILRKLYSFNVK